MLHIVICDDEPIIAEKIKNIIVSQMADTNEDYQLTAKYNGNDLLAFVSENQADLIFWILICPKSQEWKLHHSFISQESATALSL